MECRGFFRYNYVFTHVYIKVPECNLLDYIFLMTLKVLEIETFVNPLMQIYMQMCIKPRWLQT